MNPTIDIAAVHPKMGTAELPWPARKSEQAAGWDCCAAIDEPLEMWSGRSVVVPLGFALAIPEGWEAQMRPRSGLATKGLTMPNGPGTIDSDYRGEVKAILHLLYTASRMIIYPGDRVAQLVIAQVPPVRWNVVPHGSLEPTARGEGGFGSTGAAAQ